ncbi:MAG: hypothetical protein RLZZ555_34 [Pseudomonadota bacterium]|jgi:hypothetical protein
MKVFNLACASSHLFEGWFGSEPDYLSQLERGLLECPVCGDRSISKLPSAPRLNLRSQQSAAESPVPATTKGSPAVPSDPAHHQAAMLRALRELATRSEDVGERFAEEARRIHHGESEQRSIRGRTSVAEVVELLEEGIGVLPLPDLPPIKETLQ